MPLYNGGVNSLGVTDLHAQDATRISASLLLA